MGVPLLILSIRPAPEWGEACDSCGEWKAHDASRCDACDGTELYPVYDRVEGIGPDGKIIVESDAELIWDAGSG